MHTRKSNLYFCMVKIKNFKHIYVQKNVKWDNSLKLSIVKKLLGLEGLRVKRAKTIFNMYKFYYVKTIINYLE